MNAPNGKGAKTYRRRLRFSLRTLLLLVTVVALLLAIKSNRARRQRDAVTAVTRLGGWVRYDYQMVDDKFDPIATSHIPEWLLAQLGIDYFHDVVRVNMVYNDDGPKRIDNDQTSDEVLQHLPAFPKLKVLALHETQSSDDGLKHVARLRHLEKIYMWDAHEVGHYGVRHLAKLRRLKYVHLSNARITDEALRIFGTMPQLQGLSLQGNRFTDRGLEHLKGLEHLESLWVDLGQSRITAVGLRHLYGMSKLKSLGIQNAAISRNDLDELKKRLPNVTIHHALARPPRDPEPPFVSDSNEPRLRYLAWDYKPQSDFERAIVGTRFSPGGIPIEDKTRLAVLDDIRKRVSVHYPDDWKILNVYVSHPQFQHDSFGEISLLDRDGQPVSELFKGHLQSRSRSAGESGDDGWQFFQVAIERWRSLPERATLLLRYTVGDWQHIAEIPPNRRIGSRITEGVYLLAIGEGIDGHTSVSIVIEPDQASQFQFDLAAQHAKGRSARQPQIYRRAKDGEPVILTFTFSVPLAEITHFQLRSRDMRKTRFGSVQLLPDYVLPR